VLALSLVLDYGAGFGLKFVIITMTLGFVIFFIHERIWAHIKWLKDEFSDTKKRSLIKTVSWRVMSFIVLFIIGKVLGLSSEDALIWTIANNGAFIVVHYLHERLWNKITWGRA
jgi:uncharacterized membrane protein